MISQYLVIRLIILFSFGFSFVSYVFSIFINLINNIIFVCFRNIHKYYYKY
jgi:hypothetical protein